MATNTTKAQIYTTTEWTKLAGKHRLPKSLTRAAGLLRGKRKALEQHIKTVRGEWARASR